MLIGNTRGGNVVRFFANDHDDDSGKKGGKKEKQHSAMPLLEQVVGGLDSPGKIVVNGQYLYISVGDEPETSTIVRVCLETGEVDKSFLKSRTDGKPPMHRPYGFALYRDTYILVSSFRTDKILVYDLHNLGQWSQSHGHLQ